MVNSCKHSGTMTLTPCEDKGRGVLDGAGCKIPQEIVGVIIIGTIAQWTGKPVALESMDNKTK